MYNTGIPLPPQQTAPQGMQQPQGMQPPTGLGAQSPFTVPGMWNMMPGNQLAGGQNPFAVRGMPVNPAYARPQQPFPPGMGQPVGTTMPPVHIDPMPGAQTAPGPTIQPGFPSNPNVSMPIGAPPATEGYGGMGGMGGGLMNFFQSLMNRGGGQQLFGQNVQDMIARMQAQQQQHSPQRDELFQRYGARSQKPGVDTPDRMY